MKKKYFLMLNSFILFLISTIVVTAQGRRRSLIGITPNPTGFSPIGIVIFVVLFLGIGYLIYRLFTKDKKKF